MNLETTNQKQPPLFYTSNKYKIEQFKRFCALPELSYVKFSVSDNIPELREPLSNPMTVILDKSKTAGDNTIVEDTYLEVEGEVIIDTKYRLEELSKRHGTARWVTLLAHNNNGIINVYQGVISGMLFPCETFDPEFGFDDFFYPSLIESVGLPTLNKCDVSYSYMRENEPRLYTEFSPRYKALLSFARRNFIFSCFTHQVKEWEGEWQE